VSVCSCRQPDAALVEGVAVCARCGEKITDAREERRDQLLAAVARGLAGLDRRLADGPSYGNGHGPEEPALTFNMPPALIEAIAERAAEIAADRVQPTEDGWLRGAQAIADYIGAPAKRVYNLASRMPPGLPVHRDGRSLLARRSELDAWIRNEGNRP
jgi:glutathione S-transferase